MTKPRERGYSTDRIPPDAAFDLLRHSHRRTILATVVSDERALTLNDLTKIIAMWDRDEPITEISGDELAAISAALHHAHIPRLVDVGVVTYDENRHLIEPTDRLEEVKPYLDAVPDHDH
ncbi:hypothetical protein AB7C87_10545 [Natrarchaeobius sp. A-rgal3]|uniref:DUF7344 domain-containing protein n=1 Tax=Natrarchaeobius versutus TaxID=1679078 RepID=UPI00350F39FF